MIRRWLRRLFRPAVVIKDGMVLDLSRARSPIDADITIGAGGKVIFPSPPSFVE